MSEGIKTIAFLVCGMMLGWIIGEFVLKGVLY
jgi:hypothetical protein